MPIIIILHKTYAFAFNSVTYYCNWFVKAFPNSKTSTYILNKNNPMKEASDYVFWFGKHRTRSIRAVLKEDMEYCKWFVETYPTKKETLFIIKTKIYNKHRNQFR
jgi:hypothetical protein